MKLFCREEKASSALKLWIIHRAYAAGIMLPHLCAAWMQTACSWAKPPSGRSSASRRPCVGSGGDLRSPSRCCSQTNSFSCLRHCYIKQEPRERHVRKESSVHDSDTPLLYRVHTHRAEVTSHHKTNDDVRHIHFKTVNPRVRVNEAVAMHACSLK